MLSPRAIAIHVLERHSIPESSPFLVQYPFSPFSYLYYSLLPFFMSGAISESVLFTKNVLSLTTKNSNQILFECGRGMHYALE